MISSPEDSENEIDDRNSKDSENEIDDDENRQTDGEFYKTAPEWGIQEGPTSFENNLVDNNEFPSTTPQRSALPQRPGMGMSRCYGRKSAASPFSHLTPTYERPDWRTLDSNVSSLPSIHGSSEQRNNPNSNNLVEQQDEMKQQRRHESESSNDDEGSSPRNPCDPSFSNRLSSGAKLHNPFSYSFSPSDARPNYSLSSRSTFNNDDHSLETVEHYNNFNNDLACFLDSLKNLEDKEKVEKLIMQLQECNSSLEECSSMLVRCEGELKETGDLIKDKDNQILFLSGMMMTSKRSKIENDEGSKVKQSLLEKKKQEAEIVSLKEQKIFLSNREKELSEKLDSSYSCLTTTIIGVLTFIVGSVLGLVTMLFFLSKDDSRVLDSNLQKSK